MAATKQSREHAQPVWSWKWLRQNGHSILADMAESADNDEEALTRLLLRAKQDGDGLWAQIAVRIQTVKNDIEESNNDVHRIDPN